MNNELSILFRRVSPRVRFVEESRVSTRPICLRGVGDFWTRLIFCDAITKNTQKSSGLFHFLWYHVVLEGGIGMDMIRELFYGNIHPFERDIPKDSECDKLNKLIIRHDAAIKATLNEQEAEILEKLKDALIEQSSLSECEGFVNGFQLGVRLIAEVFCCGE